MESDKEKLIDEMLTVMLMTRENPCGMSNGLMGHLYEVIHNLFGTYCIEGASREQVARYYKRDVRTITRWKEQYSDFPLAGHHGHKEITYDWMDVVRWKLKHSELFEK